MDKINILGTEYSLQYLSSKEDKKLEDLDGYTDFYLKRIVVEKNFENRLTDETKIKNYQNKILRHEIIHAFLFESGLDCNSLKVYNWAENEEMVDWFAIQSPKIFMLYKELDIL
jgi:hypothetical protein